MSETIDLNNPLHQAGLAAIVSALCPIPAVRRDAGIVFAGRAIDPDTLDDDFEEA